MYFFGKSDIGMKRATNQDTFRCLWLFDNCCLCVVCDGMGGASGGNIASEIAVKFFTEHLRARFDAYPKENGQLLLDPIAHKEEIASLLTAAADRANAAIYSRGQEDTRLNGMGTTLVAALIIDRTLFVLNIGDSRLYRISRGTIRQLTRDHSYLQHLIDSGQMTPEEAENAPIRNIITRSLGTEEFVRGDLYLARLKGEGYLLLCSDGLSGYLDEQAMLETILAPVKIHEVTDHDYELEDKVTRLISLANENGGGDNITAILLKYTEESAGKEQKDE